MGGVDPAALRCNRDNRWGQTLRPDSIEGAADIDFELTALAIVGATEAVADRIAEGDVDLDAATDLLVGIVWRGLKGVGTDRATT